MAAGNYQNFKVAVYSRAYETREMGNPGWLEQRWNEITRQVKVDKLYLETHRVYPPGRSFNGQHVRI
jgi:hypothetical protein